MTKVLVTGGTGLLGTVLIKALKNQGIAVNILSRKENLKQATYQWDVEKNTIDPRAFEGIVGIIHLAGANIGEQRWTTGRKQALYDSRINSTNMLFQAVKNNNIKLDFFISASAVGYYGSVTNNTVYNEAMPPGSDFLAKLCVDWEKEALRFEELGTRVAIVRTGVVLSNTGGAFLKMLAPIKYFIGAALGTGKQILPWIHIKDLSRTYMHILEKELSGVFNAVASEQISNKVFTKTLAKSYHKPLLLPNIPAFMLKLLLGEMATLLLEGSAIDNSLIKNTGFVFEYDTLDGAVKELIK